MNSLLDDAILYNIAMSVYNAGGIEPKYTVNLYNFLVTLERLDMIERM